MSVMKVGDVVSGQYGRCFLNIDGRRYDFMMLTNVTLKATKTESKAPDANKERSPASNLLLSYQKSKNGKTLRPASHKDGSEM